MTCRQFLAAVFFAASLFFVLAITVMAAERHHHAAPPTRAPNVSGTISHGVEMERSWHRNGQGIVTEHWQPVARSAPFVGCRGERCNGAMPGEMESALKLPEGSAAHHRAALCSGFGSTAAQLECFRGR